MDYEGKQIPIQILKAGISDEMYEMYPELKEKRVGVGVANISMEYLENLNRFKFTEDKTEIKNRMVKQFQASQAGISENQLWRTCGILYINSSGTGDVSIANGGGRVGIGIPDPSYPLQVKDAGITNTNTYFGSGQVRIGGGVDAGSNTVLSVAPGVISFDRPGVGGGALTINSNGQLTLPSQPSFFAASTAGQVEFSTGAVMVFNTTRHNTGSHYNTSNGRFTAPVAGKYLFSVNFYTYPNIRASITVAINGSQYQPGDVVPLLYHENDVGSISSGFTILLSLSANDYVEVRSRAGYVSTVYMSHSHFLGQLLS
jgi:hypothetical protein